MIQRSLPFCAPLAASLLLGLVLRPVLGQEKQPERASDQAAISTRTQEFLKALAKGNAQEVASFWTKQGEYARGADLTIRGQSNIEKAYAEHLKKKQQGAITVENESVRFLSDDTAVQEGVFVVKRPNPGESTRNHFSALLVRTNGQWHFGLLRETPEGPSLQELAWLVGIWAFPSDGAETRLAVEWAEGKKYLICRTTQKVDDQTITATQVVAVHPATGAIQSWTFESNGSIGEAVWSRNGKGWTAKVASVTSDGDKVTATTTLTPVDDNTFVFQSTERMVDGQRAADMDPIKVMRVSAGK